MHAASVSFGSLGSDNEWFLVRTSTLLATLQLSKHLSLYAAVGLCRMEEKKGKVKRMLKNRR